MYTENEIPLYFSVLSALEDVMSETDDITTRQYVMRVYNDVLRGIRDE